MFNLGGGEIIIIVLVALLVIGPKRLPQIAKTLGRMVGEFRRVSSDVQNTVNQEINRLEQDAKIKPEPKKETPPVQATPETLPDAVVGPDPVTKAAPEKEPDSQTDERT